MPTKNKKNEATSLEKALQHFSEMLINRMEEISKDWKKGWIGGGTFYGLPQNLSGRTYEGCNAFLLQLDTAMHKYHAPVYMTFPQINKEGALINKGEKSIPVFKWGLDIKDKDGKRISESDYRDLSDEEKKECRVRPYLKVFNEWNIDQTNLSEVNKEKYDAILARFDHQEIQVSTDGMYVNAAIDRMMKQQEWVCPIQYDKEEKGAYYSPSKDIIVLPTKAQFNIHKDDVEECFKDGQEYYGTALHEMAHSTGHESRLNRLKPSLFGSPEYAKEELVAELTSAMVGNALGFDRRISDNNAAYLKSWISTLRQEPKFIVSVMSDVNKASRMEIEHIDQQRNALGEKALLQGALDGEEEKVKNEQQLDEIKEHTKQQESSESVEQTGKDSQTKSTDAPKEAVDKDLGEDLSKMPGIEKNANNSVPFGIEEEALNPKAYFATLMTTLNDGLHEGHTALGIKNVAELRDFFKDNPHVGEWLQKASDKEIIEAGADMLPSLRYSHKEGRTLYDMEAAYSNINAKYEDVTDDRTRQIAHRIDQAKSIITAYHNNIEETKGEDYIFNEDSVHKMIPKEDYAKNVSQTIETTPKDMDDKYYFSHTYLQSTDSCEELDNLVDKKDYDSLLYLAKEYDQGDALKQCNTYKNAKKFSGDDILAENDNYAVVYNSSVGGTYDLMRKVTKQDIIDNIERYGLDSDASEDVKKVAYENVAKQTNAVPHEDSNVQTDVAGLAKDFAEEGKPMVQAEKEAKAVVEDKQHEAFHEEEAKKQAEKEVQAKAVQEKAEKNKQQQESKKEDKPSKEVVHAAILLGALASAKENDGVWMNKEAKGNAEFMFSHTPVTAYNNIMLNLESEQKGYRTNVFTFFDKAKDNGVAIKQGEKSMPFNWTQWDYQNLTDKDDIITDKEYKKLSDDAKKMYGRHASRLTQYIFNIDQTTYPAVGGEKFITLLKEKGAQQESMRPTTSSSLMVQYKDLKSKHPDAILLFRVNDNYEAFKEDAKKVAAATKLSLDKKNIDGKKVEYVSFPHRMLDTALPKVIRAGHRVAVCDQVEDPKLVKSIPDTTALLNKAYATAKAVTQQSGMKYERVMVLQDAKYDKAEDKITVSGLRSNNVGSERIAALQKANDIYRAVVASTGTENRLDRSGRNSLLPEDDAKHEKLVQELAAGVLMARQGLPAIMSKESQKLIPYWEREFKENPKMVGVIERDVNNAVETIDNLVAKREVNYQAIRGQLPPKMITDKTENYSIASELAKLPSIDTKEVVVVKNVLEKEADVILPAGASLEVNNEVSGMRKDRIAHALKKEGYDEVRFYNAGGSLGLNKPNSYFKIRDVSLNQLKQYQLINHKTIDVTQQSKQENKAEIEKFQAIRDDHGRWAFYIKPKNEPQFSVYPTKEHMNTYWRVCNTPEKKATHDVLAQKWYEVAKQHPEIKVDLITPHPAKDIDMSRIVNPTITKSAQDNNVKLAFATIDGVRQRATINETQWNRMWLADDKAEYKKAVAAVVFEPILKKGVEQQQSEAVKEAEKVEVKDAPEPVKKKEEQEEHKQSRSMHV